MKSIETTNLTKKYGNNVALNKLCIKIPTGKLTAYLGTNGAGKSTTMRLLTKTLQASSGTIQYLSKDGSISIGVVFQNSVLDEQLSVIDNLLLRGSMYKNTTKHNIISLMKETGIYSFSKKKYGALSGGMRRKVDITRALINTPDILFLDEPTTGLDPQSREDIWQLLNTLKQNGLGIFLTTHYLEEAEFADYIYILENGQILEEGSSTNLKNKYNKLIVRLYSDNIFQLEKNLSKYHIVEHAKSYIDISVENLNQIIDLLNQLAHLITNFSYQPIDLNDVFLQITKHKGVTL